MPGIEQLLPKLFLLWLCILARVTRTLGFGITSYATLAPRRSQAPHAFKRPKLGSAGDATVLTIREGRFDYVDVVGEHLEGDRKIDSVGVVIAGRWWHPKSA